MKNSNILKFLFIGVLASFVSCEKNEVTNETVATVIPKEITDNIVAMGIGSASSIEIVIRKDQNGIPTKYYQIQDDVLMTADQILHPEKHQDPKGNKSGVNKQYRTYYGIYPWRTISVRGISGGSNGLTGNQVAGLRNAIARYNNLGLGIRFSLSFGGARDNNEIVVQNDNSRPSNTAQSGFPSSGRAFHTCWIGNSFKGGNINTATTIITHEIGHCIGLRHTDWFDRSSCGQTGESQGSEGAVHIPNTTTWRDPNSTMNACVGSQTGFSNWDREALNWWY
jgi:Dual-action HEIGH metallo-peptidase